MKSSPAVVLLVLAYLLGTTDALAQEPPTIRDVRPDTVVGLEEVTIFGSNFASNDGSVTTVWLDGQRLTEVSINSGTEIVVVVSPNPAPRASLEIDGSRGHFRRTLEVRVGAPDEDPNCAASATFTHVTWAAALQPRVWAPVGLYLLLSSSSCRVSARTSYAAKPSSGACPRSKWVFGQYSCRSGTLCFPLFAVNSWTSRTGCSGLWELARLPPWAQRRSSSRISTG